MHELTAGHNNLPKILLTAPDGARTEIYLHGAHVTSWTPAGGERLYLSPRAEFRPGAAIRGGAPVIFPQFAGIGPLPKHGFARSMVWRFTGAEESGEQAAAHFTLTADAATQRIWPHDFLAELTVAVGELQLALTLAITNRGAAPLHFTAALHTYLAVDDLAAASVTGLSGVRYADSAAGGAEAVDLAAAVQFGCEVDRIYFDAPTEVRLNLGTGRTTVVRSAGFPDAVIWNPGAVKGEALTDLEPDGWRRFVCIEAAAVGRAVELAAGESWRGTQQLFAYETEDAAHSV